MTTTCRCGCPTDLHIGEIGCPCGLPDERPCRDALGARTAGAGDSPLYDDMAASFGDVLGAAG